MQRAALSLYNLGLPGAALSILTKCCQNHFQTRLHPTAPKPTPNSHLNNVFRHLRIYQEALQRS